MYVEKKIYQPNIVKNLQTTSIMNCQTTATADLENCKIAMNHQKVEKFLRAKTAKSALCHRFKEHMEHQLRFSTSSLICVQINDDLFAIGTVHPITYTF